MKDMKEIIKNRLVEMWVINDGNRDRSEYVFETYDRRIEICIV